MRLVAGVCLLLAGCFYLDPINQRPSIGEFHVPSDIHRNDPVTLTADYEDPDGHGVTYTWRVYRCADRDQGTGRALGCNDIASYLGVDATAMFTVPVTVYDGGPLVQALRVELEVRDDRGAVGGPTFRVLDIDDAVPTLELRKAARSYTVGAPIDLFAKYGDADNSLDSFAPVWTVVPPNTPAAYTLDDLDVAADGSDPAHRTVGKTLVPQGAGEWDVKVTATDPLGKLVEKHLVFTMLPDHAPCIARSQPVVPPDGVSLPIAEPTRFQVPLIDDDLDPYPPLSGDPHFGTTTFAWSILVLPPDGSPRQPLVGATGNSVDFDPSAFTPGKIVELRVEIFDRNHTAIPCADDLSVCSVISQPDCIQRQTWRVEAR